jgi:hypothetical protein
MAISKLTSYFKFRDQKEKSVGGDFAAALRPRRDL